MTDRMFSFITETWSPIAGGFQVKDGKIYACPYQCSYCSANDLINRFPKGNLGKKYTGDYRIHEPAMDPWFKPCSFIFVQYMSDIGAPGIPRSVIIDVLEAIRFYEAKGVRFLMMTKNPKFYYEWRHHISEKTVLGATIETDKDTRSFSLAPSPLERLEAMGWVADNLSNERFICVEPVMEFSYRLVNHIVKVRPWGVAVGYDNYHNKLPEPSLEKTEWLIKSLEVAKIPVIRKTIREAWKPGGPDLVISFSNEKARAYLLEHGKVYTMRKTRRKRPNCVTWMNAGRTMPKLADVRIVEIGHVQFINLPGSYVEQSGFSSLEEWKTVYQAFRQNKYGEGGWLYRVTLRGPVIG